MTGFGQGSRKRSLVLGAFVVLCSLAGAAPQVFAQSSINPVNQSGDPSTGSSWHPGAALSFTGGALFMPSVEDKKWQKRQPMHFTVQQTFTVAEPAGELNLGAGILYTSAGGNAERTVTAGGKTEKESKDLSFYSFGLVGALDYRLAFAPHPVVAPRFGVFGGVALQNQRTLLDTFETKTEQFYKPVGGVRAHIELSMLALNPSERGAVAYGYGVEDFVLMVGTSYLMDFNPRKSHKLNGYTLEGGIGFLLP